MKGKYFMERSCDFFNPFCLTYPAHGEISKFRFYDKQGVIFETGNGWLNYGNNDYRWMNLPSEPHLRRKVNFDRGEVFYIKEKAQDDREGGIVVYLPADTFKFHFVGETKKIVSEGRETQHTFFYEFEAYGEKRVFDKKGKDWVYKEGKYTQKIFRSQWEKTPFGLQCDKEAEELSKGMLYPVRPIDIPIIRRYYGLKVGE